MDKGVKNMMGKPTESADLSLWEITDSRETTWELAQDQTRPQNSGDNGVCGQGSMWNHWQWDQD